MDRQIDETGGWGSAGARVQIVHVRFKPKKIKKITRSENDNL
jgi:hypothetical protein